jgi:signal transduction histidine kinase
VNPAKRLKQVVFALFGVSLAMTLGLLFYLESDNFTKLQSLSERVAGFDKQRLQQEFAEKCLDMIAPLARQAEDSSLDFNEQVTQLGKDPVIMALFSSGRMAASAKANPKAKPETLNQALARLAGPKKRQWQSVEVVDKDGALIGFWPPEAQVEKSLKNDAGFAQLKSGAQIPGVPMQSWVKVTQAGKDGKPVQGQKGGFGSLVSVVCGIEDKKQNFAGMLRVLMRTESLFGFDPARSFKALKELSPKSALILQRGNGEQLLNTVKGPYIENSASIPDLKDVLAAMQAKTGGWAAVKSYDGKPALLIWKRVGSWAESRGAGSLLSMAALLPEDDQKAAGTAAGADAAVHFYKRPLAILLLLLAFGLPMGLGAILLQSRTEPLRRLMEVAGRIDEFGAVPEGLEFREEADASFSRVNQALNALIKRAASTEHRSIELDQALRRVEDQASKDATAAAQEISELRGKVAGAESEKAAANAKFEAAQKARADAEAQLGNLKSALETAQRSIDLKNSENKNLSTQIQDLMRSLEEQRKVAQQVQENTARRDDELVRLSAVNTLSSELKATLTVIKKYISTMLGSVGAISDAQQEFLGVVINKSARLERLIADLVELSEIGSGIKPPKLETLAAASLVQEALLNTRPQADHKKIALEFAESGSVPPFSVDKERVGAIVRALLAQAVKVTSRGEKVSILVGTRENNVELRFSDPGMSLPPDRAAKVFNQFHGVDSQAGPEFIGTGLRFPIMRAIVEAHGGKVWIESQVGRGKTFVISIPKTGAMGAPALKPPAAMPMMPPPGALPSPPPAAKPEAADTAKFDSIFGEMPAAPAPPKAPPAGLPGLPPLGSLPPLGAVPAPPPAGPPGLPKLGGLPPLTPPMPAAPAIPKPMGPPPGPGAVPAPPLAFKTEAAKAPLKEEDKSSFDAIFGAPPAQATESPKPGGLPKVELKTGAALGDADKSNFDAIFGGASPPKPIGPPPAAGAVPAPPPPGMKPAMPADLSNFDAIFGAPAPKPVGPPPIPGAIPAPPPPKPSGGLNTMDDLNSMLGG